MSISVSPTRTPPTAFVTLPVGCLKGTPNVTCPKPNLDAFPSRSQASPSLLLNLAIGVNSNPILSAAQARAQGIISEHFSRPIVHQQDAITSTLKIDANSIHSHYLRWDHLPGHAAAFPARFPMSSLLRLCAHHSSSTEASGPFSTWITPLLCLEPSRPLSIHSEWSVLPWRPAPFPLKAMALPLPWLPAVASGSLGSAAVPLMSRAHSCHSGFAALYPFPPSEHPPHPPPLSLCSKVSLSDIIPPPCTAPSSPAQLLLPHTPAPRVPHPCSAWPFPWLHVAVHQTAARRGRMGDVRQEEGLRPGQGVLTLPFCL